MTSVDSVKDNAYFGQKLREAHTSAVRAKGDRPRLIRLPDPKDIRFRGDGNHIHIEMTADAVRKNMQTNEAAFEGWSLALRLWLYPDVQTVTLHWEVPNSDELNPHYARFLYRVQRFEGLFDWFDIGTVQHLASCRVKAGGELFLNVAGAVSREPKLPKRETKIERALTSAPYDELVKKRFLLTDVDRQFPVGLYQTADLQGRVFTAGTSAIDIIGTSPEALTVFELKAGDNIDIGGLGELLFYASVVRDAAGPKPRFKFGNPRAAESRSSIGPKDVQVANAVRAILLAEKFHPLLEHPLLATTVNEAAAKQNHFIPLTFEAVRISGFDDNDPRFKRFAA